MPNTAEEQRRVVTRLRRIKGQADALERAVLAGTDCGLLLQQLSALRGAANGLMAEVLESHLRETFLPPIPPERDMDGEVDRLARLVRSYLR